VTPFETFFIIIELESSNSYILAGSVPQPYGLWHSRAARFEENFLWCSFPWLTIPDVVFRSLIVLQIILTAMEYYSPPALFPHTPSNTFVKIASQYPEIFNTNTKPHCPRRDVTYWWRDKKTCKKQLNKEKVCW